MKCYYRSWREPNRDHRELIGGDEVKTKDEDEIQVVEQEEDFELVKWDLLVVQRVLNAQVDISNEQRENIFHTQCQIRDKVWGMIIDNESCTNVVSTILVEKLGLTTIPHPKPYSLRWLNENGEIQVTKQFHIPFSINTYHDEVLCDVTLMLANHVLLGRPW